MFSNVKQEYRNSASINLLGRFGRFGRYAYTGLYTAAGKDEDGDDFYATTAFYVVDSDFFVRIPISGGQNVLASFSLDEPAIKRLLTQCGITYAKPPSTEDKKGKVADTATKKVTQSDAPADIALPSPASPQVKRKLSRPWDSKSALDNPEPKPDVALNCVGLSNVGDKLTCEDPELAEVNRKMMIYYQQNLSASNLATVGASLQDFIEARDHCANTVCIREALRAWHEDLSARGLVPDNLNMQFSH